MTASEVFADNTGTSVSSGGTTAPAGGTTETWTVASSASFPAAATGVTQFHVTDPAASTEKIAVTNISGATWTVTRGAEGTTPVAHATGFTVQQVVTAGVFGTFAQAGLGDLGGTGQSPQVTGTHLASPLPLAQGGTGQNAASDSALLAALGAADLNASSNHFAAGSTQYVGPGTVGGAGNQNTAIVPATIYLTNKTTPSSAPAVKFIGGSGGWDMGVDVANHGGGKDFYIGTYDGTTTNDIVFIDYDTSCVGIGHATPPSDAYQLEIRGPASNSVGGVNINQNPASTANLFVISDSGFTPQIWVDSGFRVNSKAGNDGVLFVGEATNQRVIAFTNNAHANEFLFYMSDNTGAANLRLRYADNNIDVFNVDTGGRMTIYRALTLGQRVAPAVSALTFGASIAVDASLANVFNLTLTASTGTLANPTNPVDGQTIRIRVIQDGTGSRTLAYGTAYDFGAAGAPVLSTGANKVDILGFEYVASISKWCYLGSGLGF